MLFWGYRRMRPAPFGKMLRNKQRTALGVVLKLVALQEQLPFLYNFLFNHITFVNSSYSTNI